jgi:zeaxanthin glucosyltransferase
MKVAFVSLPVAGHLNPMLALAAKFKSRGHEVIFISVVDAEARAVAASLPFVAIGQEHLPLGITDTVEKQFSVTQGENGLKFTFDLMATITGVIIRELEGVLAAVQPDGVIFDTYQPYLELSAVSLELPYIHIANAAPFDVSGETPLCFFDWEYMDSAPARERNLRGVESFRKLLEPSLKVAKEYANEKQIEVDWENLTATRSRLAWITQLPQEFDFHATDPDGSLYHAGPFVNEQIRPSVEFPWDRLTGAPLVYASMGTLQNGIESVFRHILKAAGALTNIQFVVAIGNKLDRSSFEPIPQNVVLVDFAPQLDLLKRASLCLTHAGLNTVLEALSFGVPLVALPVTNDQPGVASRIRSKSVGEFLTTEELSADSLQNLIEKVLTEPHYRQNAASIGDAIALNDGLANAANRIEAAFSQTSIETTANA